MTTAPADQSLPAAIGESQQRIRALLAALHGGAGAEQGPGPRAQLLISLLGAHLSAGEHAVARALDPTTAGAQAHRAHDIEQVMRALQRHLGGDMLAAGAPGALLGRLERLAEAYLAAEAGALAGLAEAGADLDAVDRRFAAALPGAPTRPHPALPHGRAGVVPRRLLAGWDKILDVLDNRPPGWPKARPVRAHGLWDRYLLGGATEPRPGPPTSAPTSVERTGSPGPSPTARS